MTVLHKDLMQGLLVLYQTTCYGYEGGQLRFYTTPTDTATSESDFVERYRIESSGMIRHSGGHGNNGGNLDASAY